MRCGPAVGLHFIPERKVGELLAEMEMNNGELKRPPRSRDGTTVNALKDIGIN